jgi:hypothetical protein
VPSVTIRSIETSGVSRTTSRKSASLSIFAPL